MMEEDSRSGQPSAQVSWLGAPGAHPVKKVPPLCQELIAAEPPEEAAASTSFSTSMGRAWGWEQGG